MKQTNQKLKTLLGSKCTACIQLGFDTIRRALRHVTEQNNLLSNFKKQNNQKVTGYTTHCTCNNCTCKLCYKWHFVSRLI